MGIGYDPQQTMAHRHCPQFLRSSLLPLALALGAALVQPARAVCLPFSEPDLNALERAGLRESGPSSKLIESAIADAAADGDRLREAQLWAMVATRSIPLGDPARVSAAAAKSRAALAALGAAQRTSAAATRVAQRLELDTASVAATPDGNRAAVRRVETLLESPGIDDDVRACALIVRSLRHSDLGEQRAATTDALEAFRLAEAGGYAFAHADAAIMLATTYRRAGLTGPASRFIEDAIARAPRVGPPGMIARARYVQSQVHLDARQYDAALASLGMARDVWRSLDNRFGQIAADQMACAIAVERSDWPAAELACILDPSDLLQAGRPDMAVIQGAYSARLAVERGATDEAARLIDAAVALIPNPPPQVESRLMQIRARIRGAQGRWPDAFADTLRGAELENLKREAERAQAAELLDASIVAERALQENKLLRLESLQAAAALRHETTVRNLWAAAAVAAAVAVASLLALLMLNRRRQQRDRHAQAIVATLAANSPDALLLVGHEGRVRVANRGLFGGAPPTPGLPLAESLPAGARDTTLALLGRATQSRVVQAADITVETADGMRMFELKCAPIVVDDRAVGATLQACDVTAIRHAARAAASMVTRERARVAGALHEGLGQELSGVAMMLSSLARQSRRGVEADPDSLEAAAATLVRSVDRTRGLARDVAPVVVARRSLEDALAGMIMAAPATMQIGFTYSSTATLSDAVSDELFRSVRELIAAACDLGARSLRIEVADVSAGDVQAALDIELSVHGDGAAGSMPFDLAVMEHRLRGIGGSISIARDANGMVRVCVAAPSAAKTANQTAPAGGVLDP